MEVEDLRKGIRAVIEQYAQEKETVVNRSFAVAKTREEMLELSDALSDVDRIDKKAIADEIADVIGMAFVLSDEIGVNPIAEIERKWLSRRGEAMRRTSRFPAGR